MHVNGAVHFNFVTFSVEVFPMKFEKKGEKKSIIYENENSKSTVGKKKSSHPSFLTKPSLIFILIPFQEGF